MHGTHARTQQPLHEGLVSQEDARGGGGRNYSRYPVWIPRGTPSKGIGDRLPDESSRKFLRYV